jgi:glucose-6-phosphate 1-dehydrogenase
MTFHSIYRLEARELLDCPIVGVAGHEWSLDQLRDRARTSIANTVESIAEQVFRRLAERLSYAQGDFTDAATYARQPPPVHPYAPGSWGSKEAEQLLAGAHSWHGPWVAP